MDARFVLESVYRSYLRVGQAVIGVRTPVVAVLLSSVLVYMGTLAGHAQSPTTYYIDCNAGKDTNSGTSALQAWQSIAKANSASLKPGDKLLLKRGCTWQGPLQVSWHGTADRPIVVSAYGSGNLPKIRDANNTNVVISGSHLIVEYIETTLSAPPNPDPKCNNQPVAWKVGFSFGPGAAYNTLQHSKANHLAIGVFFDYTSHHNRVLNNQLTDNNVVWELKSNHSLGAMGVLLHGEYQEIAYNTFSNNRTICTYTGTTESNSIELHGARFSNIHHNVSYNDRVFSELGSGVNYPSHDNTYAYNLHVVGPQQSKIGSRFIVTRGAGHAHGPVWRTKVYNNTVYHTGQESKGITCEKCGSEVLLVKNNIFWVDREPISADGSFVEEHNVFWNSTGNPLMHYTKSGTSLVANPLFVNTGASNFRLKVISPAINAGTMESVSAGYQADLDNVAVPQSGAVDIGAYELAGDAPPPSTVPTPTPTPVPGDGPIASCSISINDGALYTGNRTVQVKVNVPNATQIMLSNDAGFANAALQPYQPQFEWTLRDTQGYIATQMVYARVMDATGTLLCGGSQLMDDIIYDPLPPTVTVALADTVGAAAAPDGDPGAPAAWLSIMAADQENGSGVAQMQVSLDETFGDATWQPYSPTAAVSADPGQTIYVRVQDGSGNISQTASVSVTTPEQSDLLYNIYLPHMAR